MKLSLILFIMGIICISAGYAKQMKPSCSSGIDIKYLPRSVYDEMAQGRAYTEKNIDGNLISNDELL